MSSDIAAQASRKQGSLIAVIGDELKEKTWKLCDDTVTGFLLAGIGNTVDKLKENFFIVDSRTLQEEIEAAFHRFTQREDISILLINQFIADDIRHLLDEYEQVFPTVLEIPSKDHPYELEKDSVVSRIQGMFQR